MTLDFYISRPNTGQQVKQETLGELKKKYKKVEFVSLRPMMQAVTKLS